MSSLINQKIKDTYEGLIKTSDDQPIDGTLKNLQDGNGGVLPIQVSTSTVNFTGAVTGISPGGLISGTGSQSMQSAASLTTTAADASGAQSIALGDNATAGGPGGIAIGRDATQLTNDGVVIGPGASSASNGTAIGPFATTTGNQGMAIGHSANAVGNGTAVGRQTDATGGNSVAVGNEAQATAINAIAIGQSADALNQNGIAIGNSAAAEEEDGIAMGRLAKAHYEGVAIGKGANAGTVSNKGNNIAIGSGANADTIDQNIAIGNSATANKAGGIAIGQSVTTGYDNTLSTKALELQTDSTPTAGGIIMSDAGGTDRRINITAAGALQIDSSGIGGFKVKTTTQVTNATVGADETLVSLLIPANTLSAGDLIDIYAHVAFDFGGGGSIYFNAGLGPAVNNNIMQVGTGGFGTGAGVSTKRTVAVHVADGTGLASSTPAIDTNARGNTYPMNGYTFPDNDLQALDWTSDMYLNIYVFVDNAGSSATLMSAYAKVV